AVVLMSASVCFFFQAEDGIRDFHVMEFRRVLFRSKRLADHQVIRHKLAEMARHINVTQAYLEQCAVRVMAGERPVADLSLLKVQASQTMEFCAREAMQIMGGAGYMRGCRIERIYREVRVMAIGGGSEEIMRDLAARQMSI